MFYIFHGDDELSQQETVAELLAKLGDPGMLSLNTTYLEGKTLTLAQLKYACEVIPFLADKRVAIVSNFFSQKQEKGLAQEVQAYLGELPPFTRLIFQESQTIPSNRAILKLAQESKSGYVKAFKKPEGGALIKWVQDRVTGYHGRIEPAAAQLLAANIGGDLRVLESEVNKLTLYRGAELITVADVMRMSPYAAEGDIFELVDALGQRNGAVALTLMQQKLAAGNEPFQLFAMIIRQFRLLIQVKELMDEGVPPADIAKEAKLHPFVVGKLGKQCQNFTMPQLEQIYRHLLTIDVGVKTGQWDDLATALDLFIAGLAR